MRSSPFYPKRARWTAEFHYASVRFREFLAERGAAWRGTVTLTHLFAGFFIPGAGFRLIGRGAWFRPALLIHLTAAFLYLVFLGKFPASLAVITMLFIHGSSANAVFTTLEQELSTQKRLIIGLVTSVLLWLFVYFPLQRAVGKFVRPVTLYGSSVVVRVTGADSVRIGHPAVYETTRDFDGGVNFVGGVTSGTVLAAPGDRLFITESNVIRVGRTTQEFPRLGFMPATYEIQLGINEWFIWPELHATNPRGLWGTIAEMHLALSIVNEEKIIGVVPQRWFGWKQL